jgi:BASS family bile acid:Na+ symporter
VVLLLGALLIVVSAAPTMWQQIGDGTILVLVAFILVGLLAGHALGGPDPEERTDLALATASRHPGIALATAQIAVPSAQAVTALVAIYLLVNVVIGLPYIKWRAGLDSPEPA